MWKWIVGIAGGIGTLIVTSQLLVGVASEVHTDTEAKTWRDGHILTEAEKFKADRVDRVERESARIEFDLLDETLSIKEVDFMKRQLLKNDAKIKCIREDKC